MKVTPYLNFQGQCREAMNFYADCIGGEITFMETFGNSPMADELPPEHQEWIMHAHLSLGEQWSMMASDAPFDYQPPQGFYVSLHPETPAEAERLFNALTEGGRITMPYGKTFWSEGFGMLVDRFGTPWMINCDQPCGEPTGSNT